MILANHATISTSNLERTPIAQVITIDLEGFPYPAIEHSNGTVSIFNANGKQKFYRNTEEAWLALYLDKHNLSQKAKAFSYKGYSVTLYGSVYCQAPAYVQAEYQGENDEPCIGGFDYLYWLYCDGQLITSQNRQKVIQSFNRIIDWSLLPSVES